MTQTGNRAMHYLDCAATTAVDASVAALACAVLEKTFANPSSLYAPGLEAEQAIENARGQLAAALGCAAAEVFFTGGGTEANNIALLGAARARKNWGTHLVATGYEHPSGIRPLEMLARQEGFHLTTVPPGEDGVVDPGHIVDAVGPETALVCAMHVNNETGAVLDVAALAEAVKQKNHRTAVHVDGIQGFTKLPIALGQTKIDTYAVSGHKIHAPKGVGALFVRRGFHLLPPFAGGGQEKALRPGTENTAYIAALGHAAALAAGRAEDTAATVKALRAHLLAQLPDEAVLNCPPGGYAGIVNVSFPGFRSEVLLHLLEGHGVYVSSGSACAKGEPSHTLTAMGLSPERVDGALRISFDGTNTKADIDALLGALKVGLGTLTRANPRR